MLKVVSFCRLQFFSVRLLALVPVLVFTVLMNGCGGGSASGSGGSGSGSTPTPAISSISPTSAMAGSGALTLTVTGTGFLTTSQVQVAGTTEPTTYVSATQLTATVPATQIASGANLAVAVLNGSLSSGTGTSSNLEIDNPAPTITSTSPASEVIGTTSPVLTVTGTGFVPATVINVNGSMRPTTFGSATQLSVTLTAADVSMAGSIALVAVNPAPGGGTSPAASLAINNPAIGNILLSPTTLTVSGTTPATITVTGQTFISSSMVLVNGSARPTTYVNANTLTFVATVADQATLGTLVVTVANPAPGGGSSAPANLTIAPPAGTPVITSVNPTSIIVGSGDTPILVAGTGFTANSVVQWNGTALSTALGYTFGGAELFATVPAADLTTAGTATVTVDTPNAIQPLSNAVTVSLTNPPAPTLTSVYPNAGPLSTATAVTLTGTGFTASSTVLVNGAQIASMYVSATQVTATLPASSVALPGNINITVTTPAPGGGTSSAQSYTVYIAMPNNDIAYNTADGLLYASVPGVAGAMGNSVVGIDPPTGNVMRQIWVGSNPNKLAISTDGTQLFVGLDGAAAVAQVNLTSGTVVNQFSLGGGQGIYNPPSTAAYLAAVPGQPNSVAVSTAGNFNGGTGVTIFDSGVARANASSGVGYGPISFGSSASTLYMLGSAIEDLTVGPTGITGATSLSSTSGFGNANEIQYDNGQLYLSDGAVLKASTGTLLGTFYSTANTPASGPLVSDSTLGRAFIGESNYSSSGQVLVFDEGTFNSLGSIPVNGSGTQGYLTNFQKIVRWGQNGIALSAAASAYTPLNQIYIFESPLVQDLSSSPADLSVSLSAPATGTTGTSVSWVATVSNLGPNSAEGAVLAITLDPSLTITSVTASQGSCATGTTFTCDLGNLANGANATVTVNATPTSAGSLAGTANVSSTSYDPALANNQSTSTTTVTGSLYGAMPGISALSPNLVQAGSADFTLTVTGTGFNAGSTVNLGSAALSTTYVSSTQLTASVTASDIANYGWAAVTVSNPSPGGGISQILPLTIYNVVNVPASGLLFDPFSQLLYATIPGTATNFTGNSIVTINPVTGTVGTPISVGSQPTVMTETSDGNYLYIGLSGADSVAQFDLLHQSLTNTIPISITQYGSTSSAAATWLAAMPGTDTTLAINLNSTWGNFGIFDISGSTGSFRSNLSGIYSGVNPVFADASHVYAYDSQTSGAEFYRYSVDTNGLTLIDGTTLDGLGGFNGGFQLADGLVYGGGGGIANPSTTPPSQIATLPLIDFYESGTNGYGVATAADPSLQKEFLMLENTAGTSAYGLARYDLTTYLPEAVLDMPQSASSVNAGWTMLRWGQDGLALLTSAENYSTDQSVATVMLLSGPFVTPQLLQTGSAASLTASSATTLAHGSGNTIVTLTGSHFLPGVAVTWNGSYRTTTIVDATHVTVAIPASDLTSTGMASVVATNPGASGSNALQVAIN